MKKVRIVKIDKYNYTLFDGNNYYIKNIEFNSQFKPNVNDIVYISKKILDEKNLFAFGDLYKDKNVTEEDIIKVVSSNNEYYLQRQYG